MVAEMKSQKAPLGEMKRPHSIPVPRLYKDAQSILKKVKDGEGLRDLIYRTKLYNPKAVYAIVSKVMINGALLNYILDNTELLNENFDRSLAKVLVYELLFGKKELVGDSKPVQRTLALHSELKRAVKKSGIPTSLIPVLNPRFARVNTLLKTEDTTVCSLINDGWKLVDTPDSFDVFHELISNLGEDQFVRDYHFSDVFVFPSNADLYNNELVENGSLILQDKASCLPVHLLNPEPGSVVLDMCAAPGIKTAHLANLMNNEGTLYAVDMHEKRFGTLENLMNRYCGEQSCVTTKLADSTQITSKEYPGVKYILVDPSCSGTGMLKRIEDTSEQFSGITKSRRIEKLANFQERLLVQALTAFPDVERVVYSTCSILEEENEQVVERILARVPEFKVASPALLKSWEHRGGSQYPFGSDCLRADQKKDCCNGFFVVVLERIAKQGPTKVKGRKRNSGVIKEQSVKAPGKTQGKKGQIKKKKKKIDVIKKVAIKN